MESSSYNGGNIICHQLNSPVLGMGYSLLSHWPKKSHNQPTSQTPQVMVKATDYSLQPQPCYWRYNLLISSNTEKLSWLQTRALPLLMSTMVLKDSFHATREKLSWLLPSYKLGDLQQQLDQSIYWHKSDLSVVRGINHCWTGMIPIPDTTKVAKN